MGHTHHLVDVLLTGVPVCTGSTDRGRCVESSAHRHVVGGLAHVALDGRWLRVNQRLCDLVGYTREELLARTFQDITHPADLEADLFQVQRLLAGDIATYTLDKRYVRKDGALVWIALTVSLARQADGRPAYFISVVQDIDARKQAEAQVRRQAARQALLAEASQVFAATGLNTRALLDEIARRVGEGMGAPCVVRLLVGDGPLLETVAVYHPDPARARQIQEPLARAPARLDEGALLAPLRVGGKLLGSLGLGREQPGRVYTDDDAVLLQELADRAALALEAGRRFEQSVAALRARDEVLAAVSHDLKTPLAGILGAAQLLQRQVAQAGVEDERLAHTLERIVGACRRMADMMEELVDSARLEASQMLVLHQTPTDLVTLVRAAVADQEATAERHAVRVSATADRLLGAWDAARLRRVLDNLLANAIKYSPQGGEVHVELGVDDEAGRRWAVVRVADQGVGIPAADLPHIFERFRRGRNVAGIAGTGIGLSGAKQIVEQHGGRLEVDTREGVGSTFTLRLPLPTEHR